MSKPTILPEWDINELNTVEPDQDHKDEGWLAPGGIPEKPPFQTFNHWQNSVYKWLDEINIKGLLGYDAITDYVADLSYTIGSDGKLYQCLINNGPASSAVNPVGDGTGTWVESIPDASETKKGIAEIATQAETDTGTDDTKIITPKKLAAILGVVTQLGTRSTTGTWTITSLTIGKPLIIVMDTTATGGPRGIAYSRIAGAVGGASDRDSYFFAFTTGGVLDSASNNATILIPTATTVTIEIISVSAGSVLTSFQ